MNALMKQLVEVPIGGTEMLATDQPSQKTEANASAVRTFTNLETTNAKVSSESESGTGSIFELEIQLVERMNHAVPSINAEYNQQKDPKVVPGRGPGRGLGVHQIDAKTKKVVRTYVSMQSAAANLGVQAYGISMCCSGKRKKAYGFVWRRADDGIPLVERVNHAVPSINAEYNQQKDPKAREKKWWQFTKSTS